MNESADPRLLTDNDPHGVASVTLNRAARRLAPEMANREIGARLIEDSCRRSADIRVSGEGQRALLDKTLPAWSKHRV